MKKTQFYIFVVAAFLVAAAVGVASRPACDVEASELPMETRKATVGVMDQFGEEAMRLGSAIAWVESRCNPAAVNGNCVGYLQISPIMVREANRLLGWECFTYDDRLDEQGSLAIFYTIMAHHNPTLDIHRACRIWNGPGVSAWYIREVTEAYNRINNK